MWKMNQCQWTRFDFGDLCLKLSIVFFSFFLSPFILSLASSRRLAACKTYRRYKSHRSDYRFDGAI